MPDKYNFKRVFTGTSALECSSCGALLRSDDDMCRRHAEWHALQDKEIMRGIASSLMKIHAELEDDEIPPQAS